MSVTNSAELKYFLGS